jgi:hypothetical protein
MNMAIFRLRLNWIIGSLFTLTFVFLLFLRLGILGEDETEHRGPRIFTGRTRTDRETWMNIFQEREKIGYAHRQFYKTVEGYRISESVFMRINLMGMIQEIRFETEGRFNDDLTLSSFDFDLQSNLFRFKARGVLRDRILSMFIGNAGSEQKIDYPVEKETYLSVSLLEAWMHEDLRPGESRMFHVFDPTTGTQRPVKIAMLTEEMIPVRGSLEKAKKVSVDFMGVPQFAWIGKDGTVLKEEGALGIKLEQVTREEALNPMTFSRGADVAEVVSISANKDLPDVGHLKELKIRIDGVAGGEIFLKGDRQSLKDNILTIRKEAFSDLPSSVKREETFADGKTYLEPTPLIQSDHPEIGDKIKEIVSSSDTASIKAEKLVAWVYKEIQKRPVLSVPNALETLQKKVGDCNEHAVLLAALARASGIPAQVEAGLVYQNGRFYYHAWNVLYLGAWITADSVTGQLPADVTHIRFVRGTERQVDLVRMIGKVKLEIVAFD